MSAPLPPESLRTLWEREVEGFDPEGTDAGATFRPRRAPFGIADTAAAGSAVELIDEVGRGGGGIVHRARQGGLRREIAVKRLIAADPGSRARFVLEARVTASLDHPNIVPVHELGAGDGGEPVLVMKLVRGTSWKRILHPRSDTERALAAEFDLPRHIETLRAVCQAVAFAHSRGVVHLDLKPENVMIGEVGEVLVMDWGVAASLKADGPAPAASRIASPCGTPSYMPPELAEGRGADVGVATDVYLLGAILHEVIAGRPPHGGPTVMAVLLAASEGRPPELGPDVPAELAAICRRALAARPADRFEDVTSLREALGAFLAHRESERITADARARLAAADGATAAAERYEAFADALAGFRQARVLWEQSPAARAGERTAALDYARAALANDDVGLAAAQAAAIADRDADADARALVADIASRRDALRRARRRAWLARRALVAAAVAIIVGLGTGAALVNAARERAEADRAEEVSLGRVATDARERAVARRAEVEGARDAEAALRVEAARSLAHVYDAEARERAKQGDAATASLLLARALALVDDPARREALLAAAARTPRVLWGADESWGALTAAAFSPDGTRLVAGGQGTAIWDVASGRVVQSFSGYTSGVLDLAWSPEGDRVATADVVATARIWDVATGRVVRVLEGHTDTVQSIAWHPDGDRLATGSDDGTVRIWEVDTDEVLASLRCEDDVNGVAWSPAGDRLLIGTEAGRVLLWTGDPETPAHEVTRIGETTFVRSVVWSPAGDLFAAATDDAGVQIWSVRPERLVFRLDASDVRSLSWSPDGRTLGAAHDDGTVRLHPVSADGEVAEPVVLAAHTAAARAVAWPPAGDALATVGEDGSIVLWSRADGRPLARMIPPLTDVRTSFAASAERLARATVDGTLRIRDLRDGSVVATLRIPDDGPATQGFELRWGVDGRHLAATRPGRRIDGRQRVFVCDVDEHVFIGHADGPVRSKAFEVQVGPGGRVALASELEVHVLDARTNTTVGVLADHDAHVAALAWSPDGLIATAEAYGRTRLWSPDGVLVRALEAPATALSFDPRGRWLATTTPRAVIAVWDVASGTSVGRFEGTDATFAPDGSLLARLDATTLRRFDVSTGAAIEDIVHVLPTKRDPQARGSQPLLLRDGRHLIQPRTEGVRLLDVTAGEREAIRRKLDDPDALITELERWTGRRLEGLGTRPIPLVRIRATAPR